MPRIMDYGKLTSDGILVKHNTGNYVFYCIIIIIVRLLLSFGKLIC
jgi:hypothetical protein